MWNLKFTEIPYTLLERDIEFYVELDVVFFLIAADVISLKNCDS